MKRTLLLAAMLVSSTAFSAPPYDVEVTVIAPADGGAVDRYVLYLDGAEVGPVMEGANALPDLLTDNGPHTFQVAAVNAAGETRSDPIMVDTRLPGKPSIRVTISFQLE